MVVVYYTHTYFLDATLETIQSLKNKVELHVVIELSPDSKNSTIIDIDNINNFNTIEPLQNIIEKNQWQYFKKYFDGIASVHCVVFKHQKTFSFHSLLVTYQLAKFLKKLKASVFHFDTISSRAIGLLPFIHNKKIFTTIHDPVRHSGEQTWKSNIPLWVFARVLGGYFFYSKFALQQFKKNFSTIHQPLNVLRLQPYRFITQFKPQKNNHLNYILFFGRISLYKGIDLLIDSIPHVIQQYPQQHFLIIGKASNYQLNNSILKHYKNNITIINKHLTVSELNTYISNAMFIVCPYRDATQSGVLMTAQALSKTTVATNVGAFSEYITNKINGLLCEPTVTDLSNSILLALHNNYYRQLSNNINSHYDETIGNKNANTLLEAYKKN